MRYFVRPADFKDIPSLLELAQYFPLCSLPAKAEPLEKKIQISKSSFDKTLKPFKRNYIFVLQDRQKVIGSSQILSYFGKQRSLCYFLDENKKILQIKPVQKGRHQLGGLILNPEYRKSKALLGLQIGMARFLYIKSFPKDFSKKLEVSLTPPLRKKGSDFWRETGQIFLKKNYSLARKAFQKDREEFFQSFPKNLSFPIHTLSASAQNCLQQIHPQTLPIYKGLLKRGFYKTNCYHLLDGGIYLEAYWPQLPFLKKACSLKLHYEKAFKGEDYFVAQKTKDSFVCLRLKAQKKGQRLILKRNPFFEEGKKALALSFPI